MRVQTPRMVSPLSSTVILLSGILIAFAIPSSSIAGPHQGGTLILHANLDIAYSEDVGGYGSALEACEDAVTIAPIESVIRTVFFVLAAFPEGSSPELSEVAFGIDYQSGELAIPEWGHMGSSEVTEADWPTTGSGVVVTFDEPRTSELVEVYWFIGYSRFSAETHFAVDSHPVHGGYFAQTGGGSDEIHDYGSLGFGIDGYLPCPLATSPRDHTSWGQLKFLLDVPPPVENGLSAEEGR